MSVQFGKWSFDGAPAAPEYMAKVGEILSPYGPDDGKSYSSGGVDLLYYALHSTKESRRETQPHVSASGAVITWDGRLDNRAELTSLLHGPISTDSTDTSIVAAAYERWGTDCFAKLIGAWSLSIWNPNQRSLVLAKDPVGTRPLYYTAERDHITWSTILDPLVLLVGKVFELDEEYIAGWLSCFPATHLTPYAGINAVPPSTFLLIGQGRRTTHRYWDFDPDRRICYRSDAEYEEHFRFAFAQSVRRRLRSDRPVLAELSGGMDSSSIVCMADEIIANGGSELPRLDTLSYFDDSEPNWNERPYFTKVEEKRGRAGFHIDVGSQKPPVFDSENGRFAARPGGISNGIATQFAQCMTSQGYRVVLSGIGGDEVTGGVPTPTPELEDLLAGARFRTLAHQLRVWALNKRKPWFHLLFEAARGFLPPTFVGVPRHFRPPHWVHSSLLRRHRAALTGYVTRVKLRGSLPSFQENLFTLEALRRQLSCSACPCEPTYEKRYPYLDRSFLEFIFGLPREQLVRPGQRRSLMRRALVGIVPDELLNRKRKAFSARSPSTRIVNEWARLVEMNQHMVSASLGIINAEATCEAVEEVRRGHEIPLVLLSRTMSLESWLRSCRDRRIFAADTRMASRSSGPVRDVSPRTAALL
jgi:asparagine synthase (glutamine-hydrolysing)